MVGFQSREAYSHRPRLWGTSWGSSRCPLVLLNTSPQQELLGGTEVYSRLLNSAFWRPPPGPWGVWFRACSGPAPGG